ncbi:MAG: DNA repair protein RecN, partial [Muribaculaceae bacterium]|nr:DNA repair protein RecN [Muribaculaceae bacterium]
MIQTLHISNYALIDSIDITLHEGLNILTGETGAGKSIILGALSLLLGGRCDTKAVRNHEAKSVIEATFSAAGYPALEEFCKTNEIDWDPDTVILRREIAPNGRSRAFVNDCPVNLTLLQTAALHLIDIHSQHQNLLLASPPYQLRVIDSLAGNGARLEAFTTAYNNYRHAVRKFKQERRALEQAKDDEEFLRFQYKRLKDAALKADELEELEHERELLVNMADVKTSLGTVTSNLSDGEENIEQLLRQTIDEAERLGDLLEDAESLTERLRTLRVELQDIAETFSEYDRQLAGDPERLDEVEERLNQLYDLLRRHKVETIDELIGLRDNMKTRLESIDLGDETLQALELAAKRAKKEALEIAAGISQSRHDEAERISKLLKERALPLGMKSLQCEITVRATELSATGIDHVEVLFAFNKNQPRLPVGTPASGG